VSQYVSQVAARVTTALQSGAQSAGVTVHGGGSGGPADGRPPCSVHNRPLSVGVVVMLPLLGVVLQ
jgi:hypothetical protein